METPNIMAPCFSLYDREGVRPESERNELQKIHEAGAALRDAIVARNALAGPSFCDASPSQSERLDSMLEDADACAMLAMNIDDRLTDPDGQGTLFTFAVTVREQLDQIAGTSPLAQVQFGQENSPDPAKYLEDVRAFLHTLGKRKETEAHRLAMTPDAADTACMPEDPLPAADEKIRKTTGTFRDQLAGATDREYDEKLHAAAKVLDEQDRNLLQTTNAILAMLEKVLRSSSGDQTAA
ncbi:MAG: hypothetical protein PHW10_00395 [Candidatus Peribacteraceae bacterium]|nr:hypothetical protein [Candidatus Peribacteraceae bacterium]